MLGLERIQITPVVLKKISKIERFNGYWSAMEKHTTGLHLLADVATYGRSFQSTLKALGEKDLSLEILQRLHAGLTNKKEISPLRSEEYVLNIYSSDGSTEIGSLETATPETIEPLLLKLLAWTNEALDRGSMHPLLVIACFSSVFLQISPFNDHNRSLLYILIVTLMLKTGYTYAPYISLQNLITKHADDFYHALQDNQQSISQGEAGWSVWIDFFLALLSEQADILRTRLNEDKTDLVEMPALSSQIMALFREHKRLQMKEIIKLTHGRRSTLKLRLGELVDAGYLRRYGQARSTWYALV